MALRGIKVVEMAGLAPAPFAGMVLADFGADVVRVDRASPGNQDTLCRGKRSISVNLKSRGGVEAIRKMCDQADVIIEGFRPGVMERLGLGPEELMKRNPRLIYARMTGYGQTGAYANMAGHDINYLAVSGVLAQLGRKDENPYPPWNLMADFAGGGAMCAMGILMAVIERFASGKGQVIDAAMCDGCTYLGTFLHKAKNSYVAAGPRGTNLLDTGAHFYETYETKDGRYMSVGAIEGHFYAELLKGMGLEDGKDLAPQMDQSKWEENKVVFRKVFKSKTMAEWCKIFDGTDACVAPILDFDELETHPHSGARRLLKRQADGRVEPNCAPRLMEGKEFDKDFGPQAEVGQDTTEVLKDYGFSHEEIAALTSSGAVMNFADDARM
eukprot:Clim_evm13s47 gene=Clim_evmTU13s47